MSNVIDLTIDSNKENCDYDDSEGSSASELSKNQDSDGVVELRSANLA